MSLHTLLLRPAELLAWYAILRSPMVGLSLNDLEHFADAPDREAYTLQQAEVDPAVERFATHCHGPDPNCTTAHN